jgi:hypothetical protein
VESSDDAIADEFVLQVPNPVDQAAVGARHRAPLEAVDGVGVIRKDGEGVGSASRGQPESDSLPGGSGRGRSCPRRFPPLLPLSSLGSPYWVVFLLFLMPVPSFLVSSIKAVIS